MQYEPHLRRPSRRDKKAKQGRKAIIVLSILAVLIGAFGYVYFTVEASLRPTDPVTFCPTDEKGPHSITDILIDRTDAFSATQEAALRDRLNDLRDHTAKYDLFEVYTVEPTKTTLLKPEFSMCNPGRGDETNSWTGNPRLIEERWTKLFDAPLQNLFTSILVGDTAQISPIMESIQSIVVTRLGSQKIKSEGIPRHLIVVSDLLQYTKNYTQYMRQLGGFDKFRDSTYYESVRSDLTGIDIEVWYVRRKATLPFQGDKHIEFWRDYFTDQGASLDKLWYVPGT